MARTGRPPKPIEQHKRTGTYRPDRHGSSEALAVVPAASVTAGMALSPLEAFERVLDTGVHWLAETDLPAITLLRQMLEERGELAALAELSMEYRKALRDLDKQVITLLAQLGFDPASRSRLGLSEVKAASKLEELRARRRKHS